jgi:hypothetical protein
MKKILLIAAATVVASQAFATELIVNGDFEATPADTGWTLGGIAAIDDWTGYDPLLVTNTAWLGGYDESIDTITQTVNTAGAVSGFLSFDYFFENGDIAGFDFLNIYFGGNLVDSIDLGNDDAIVVDGPFNMVYDVSGYLNGGSQDVVFEVLTDDFPDTYSSAWVDNVSVDVQAVPEPASMLVLAGAAAFAARRKRK